MPQRILVAGGTGFIGGHVAQYLIQAGHTVEVLGRGSRPGPPGATVNTADRDDGPSLERELAGKRFDATLDFSAYDGIHVERLLAVPRFEPGRYVLASTGQVCMVGTAPSMPYVEADGAAALRPEPPGDTPDHPQWSYGVGKRRAEAAVAAARAGRGLEAVTLRLPVTLGEGDPSLRMWGYLERMLDGGPLLVPGGGQQPVRFLWVGDVARAAARMFDCWPLPSTTYHLAQPDIVSVADVLRRMALIVGREPEIVAIDPSALAAAGLGRECSPYSGPWVSVLDPGLAVREWGFEGTPLDGYLAQTVRAHLDRPPASSHWGYARRNDEIALARSLGTGAR